MNEDKGYRFNKDKTALWLWREVDLRQAFRDAWNGNYLTGTKDGEVVLEFAEDWEDIWQYHGKALIPEDVYIDEGLPHSFHEEVMKEIKLLAWNPYRVRVHSVEVIR